MSTATEPAEVEGSHVIMISQPQKEATHVAAHH